jgi:hypothetical protein
VGVTAQMTGSGLHGIDLPEGRFGPISPSSKNKMMLLENISRRAE